VHRRIGSSPVISGFHMVYLDFKLSPVLNFICFLLRGSPASVFKIPTFLNTLFVHHLHKRVGMEYFLQFPPHTGKKILIWAL
jgi:hypothetical protein